MIKYNKKEITKTIYELIHTTSTNKEVDQMMFKWWTSGRSGNGLRLTTEGMLAFRLAQVQLYEINLGKFFDYDTAWRLNKLMPCPFFISASTNPKPYTLYVYDSKIAMMITLYGSITEYLDSIENYIK
jgi:hypothetical protein